MRSPVWFNAFVAGLIASIPFTPETALAEVIVRVRIAEDVSSVSLGGEALRIAEQAVSAEQVLASAGSGLLRVGPILSRTPVTVRSRNRLKIDGKPAEGEVLLIPRVDAGMDVVSRVPLETYVARSAASEVYADWPIEALKAQTIVARTYALHERQRNREAGHDVDASVISQKYEAGQVSPRLVEATRTTDGLYLSHRDGPILAAFHASAGGHTASSKEVWGQALPYLKSVSSPDDDAPHYFWSYEIELKELQAALKDAGYPGLGNGVARVVSLSQSGRVRELQFGEVRLSGRELRQVLGGGAIRSTMFEVRVDGSSVRFLGSGSGHGVGLCQWGAYAMARQGKTHQEIPAHYYPGTELLRLDSSRADSAGWSALH